MASGVGLRGLKILVIAMGVLLVVGFVVLLAALGQRIASLYADREPAAPYVLDLPLAAGDRVIGMAGVGERLALRVEAADGTARVLIVDPAAGRLVGTIGDPPP